MPQSINSSPSLLSGLRSLNQTEVGLNKSLAKLASANRINSAADDAAGLSISNRFTAQINGLNSASRNAAEGISFTQVTESALAETTESLQRIRDLSLQAANGSLSPQDRSAIQKEIDQLKSEIDRVASDTTFNGKQVLNGSLSQMSFQIGAAAQEQINVGGFNSSSNALGAQPGSVQSLSSRAQLGSSDIGNQGIQEGDADTGVISDLTISTATTEATEQVNIADAAFGGEIETIQTTSQLTDPTNPNYGSGLAKSIADRVNQIRESGEPGLQGVYGDAVTTFSSTDLNESDYSGTINTNTASNVATGTLNNGDLRINGVDIGPVDVSENDADGDLANAINSKSDITGVVASVNQNGQLELRADDGRDIVISSASAETNNVLFGGGEQRFDAGFSDLRISGQVLLSADDSITLAGADQAQAGLNSLEQENVQAAGTLANLDVSTPSNAIAAVSSVDDALARIDSYRASIGAIQNRFESSIRNLSAVSESQSAARSRISDTDFASQITDLSQQQIKRQAGLALQAQANALSQQVLHLLN